MATYPTTLPIAKESRRTPRDGRDEKTLGDGGVRVRKLHGDKSDFEIVHGPLTSAQMTTLTTFHTDNALVAFDFVWPEDGLTYSVRFGENALRTEWFSAGRRVARVRMVAT